MHSYDLPVSIVGVFLAVFLSFPFLAFASSLPPEDVGTWSGDGWEDLWEDLCDSHVSLVAFFLAVFLSFPFLAFGAYGAFDASLLLEEAETSSGDLWEDLCDSPLSILSFFLVAALFSSFSEQAQAVSAGHQRPLSLLCSGRHWAYRSRGCHSALH